MWDKPQALNALSNLLYGLITLAVLYTVVFLTVNSGAFPLKEIRVEGKLSHISREQVQYIAKHAISGSFFTLSVDGTRQAFEKLPWVRQVNVRRRWPGILQVEIEEHKAMARWGETALVNTSGEVFDAASDEELPVFIGPDGTSADVAKAYADYKQLFAPKKLVPVKIELSPRRAWRMMLSNGMQLVIGRDDVEGRLKRFVQIYDKAFAGRTGIQYVDLRYANGLAIKLPPEAMAAVLAPAKPGTPKAGVPPVTAKKDAKEQQAAKAAPAQPAGKPKTDAVKKKDVPASARPAKAMKHPDKPAANKQV
ncbi:cell division protein FtsQ/DivIB [Leeia oryzae]|uniref:cell division protein FtsQ/DivIB n=1 Tax=Leeia oryzae TaxID=356662 RepID=UPI00038253E3|nr:cell division protein FtsQ/DivIB [Leeia oryzae]